MARVGKIARFPETVREELNKRLRNGELGPKILPWLNGLPEVQGVLAEYFQGQAVNAQNLSDWRQGGFKEWEEKQDRAHRVRELATFADKLTRANGSSIAEGAAAIASGRILELLEAADRAGEDSEGMDVETLKDLVGALTSLRSAELAKAKGELDREKLQRKDEEIALAKQKYQDKVQAQKREIEDALGAAKSAGGITPETLERIEQAARLL